MAFLRRDNSDYTYSLGGEVMYSIIIVDDHKIVREGIQRLLSKEDQFYVSATLSSVAELMDYVETHNPHLILLDLKLQDGDGVSASIQLKKRFPLIKIVLLSGYIEPDFALEAKRVGVEGYLLKTIALEKLISAIKRVLKGEKIYDPLVEKDIEEYPNVFKKLSRQEYHIIRLLTLGKTNKEIASEMNLAEKTARNYISHLYKKINVTNRTEAVAFYMRHRVKNDAGSKN